MIPGTWGHGLIWKEALAGCGAKVEVFGLETLLYSERYFETYTRRLSQEDGWIEET